MSADIVCCECDGASEPLRIEFLDGEGNVLGAGEFGADWCSDCDDSWAMLDNTVNSEDVCEIRLIKADGDPQYFWASFRVKCEDPCDCGHWAKIWKGDVCGWEAVPEEEAPAPVAPPPAPPAPPRVTPPPPPPPPAPPAPPRVTPPPAPPIQVEGRG